MSIFFINTLIDQSGATFNGSNGATTPYTEDSVIDNTWTVLSGTQDTFSISKPTNKVVFSFQTTAQKQEMAILHQDLHVVFFWMIN